MNRVTLTTIDGLDRLDLLAIRSRLTKPSSEFQLEVATVLEGVGSSCTPIAVWHCDGAMVGWACSHLWRAMQTCEQYVEDRYRNTGKATALTAVLLSAGVIDIRKPLAVFSPATADIARKLGFAEVILFQRAGSEWAEV